MEKRPIPFSVIRDALRRIQIAGLERSHEGPTEAQAVFHTGIHVLHAHHPVAHHAERLGDQRRLQAVEHEAFRFLMRHHRHHFHAIHQHAGAGDHLWRRPRCSHQLDQRHQIGRVDRMRDQAAGAAGQGLGERAGRDSAGRGGEDDVGRAGRVHGGEQGTLGLQPFRPVLLHIAGAFQALGHRAGDHDACRHGGRRLADQPGSRQVAQSLADDAERGCRHARLRVPHPHLMAGAGEYHRPGAPDKPRSDDRDAFHASLPDFM